MVILSPITNSANVVIESRILTSWLINEYQQELNIDVAKYFKYLDEIMVCRCIDSGYSFYYPFSTAGDGNFYSALEKFPWYYMNDKWEHVEALKYVQKDFKILEIGCGRGGFLAKAMESLGTVQCRGLELNVSAVDDARSRGLDVSSEPIEVHTKSHKNYYDMVCAFQLLEHIPNVRKFISSSLAVLKTGGLLVFCVPNNDSFIFQENTIVINMPPHHMGLWSMNAFVQLQGVFDVKLQAIRLEPLQHYHLGYGFDFVKKSVSHQTVLSAQLQNDEKSLPNIIKSYGKRILSKIDYRFMKAFFLQTINDTVKTLSPYVLGHSIFVVFQKKGE